MARTESEADLLSMVQAVCSRINDKYPSIGDELVEACKGVVQHHPMKSCKCSSVAGSLSQLRQHPSICKNHEVLDVVDKAIFNAFGHSSLRALRAEGVDMSKRAYSQAKSSEQRVVNKGGRPSKVNDSKCVAMSVGS